MISELFLQLAHSTPYLTLQWLYILILLNYCPQSFWSRVLAPDQRVQRHDEIVVSRHEELLGRPVSGYLGWVTVTCFHIFCTFLSF